MVLEPLTQPLPAPRPFPPPPPPPALMELRGFSERAPIIAEGDSGSSLAPPPPPGPPLGPSTPQLLAAAPSCSVGVCGPLRSFRPVPQRDGRSHDHAPKPSSISTHNMKHTPGFLPTPHYEPNGQAIGGGNVPDSVPPCLPTCHIPQSITPFAARWHPLHLLPGYGLVRCPLDCNRRPTPQASDVHESLIRVSRTCISPYLRAASLLPLLHR
ncbi:hypothetical protein Vafri_21186 [Volvox africanus]|uniref:Uncharacterized protein n=1 Tax=Volvox africanus TaxID=51714 RepID=A0A8J4BVB2_9CHLO|nr:hypothetical protein Vafri_21186 [Volvox africanus]